MCLQGRWEVTRLKSTIAFATARIGVKADIEHWEKRRTVSEIVLAGEVWVTSVKGERLPNPELMRLFRGPYKTVRALAFIDGCKRDLALRAAAERQGIEWQEWEEWIDYSAQEARCHA